MLSCLYLILYLKMAGGRAGGRGRGREGRGRGSGSGAGVFFFAFLGDGGGGGMVYYQSKTPAVWYLLYLMYCTILYLLKCICPYAEIVWRSAEEAAGHEYKYLPKRPRTLKLNSIQSQTKTSKARINSNKLEQHIPENTPHKAFLLAVWKQSNTIIN